MSGKTRLGFVQGMGWVRGGVYWAVHVKQFVGRSAWVIVRVHVDIFLEIKTCIFSFPTYFTHDTHTHTLPTHYSTYFIRFYFTTFAETPTFWMLASFC